MNNFVLNNFLQINISLINLSTMKKTLLFAGLFLLTGGMMAQSIPNFTDVPNLLASPKVINTSDVFDIFENRDFKVSGDYAIEVQAKMTSVDKRGLDVEAKDANGTGFRIVTTPTGQIDWSKSLTPIIVANNQSNIEKKNTFQYVMKNNVLKLYRDGLLVNDTLKAKIVEPISLMSNNGFDDGLGEWTDMGTGGNCSVVDTAKVLKGSTDTAEIKIPANKCLKVSFAAGLNNVEIISVFVFGFKPGTYALNYKYLPYKKQHSGGYNITVGVYNADVKLAPDAWHNGFVGGLTNTVDPKWVEAAPIRFVVPEGVEYVTVKIKAQNNACAMYFDDFNISKLEYPDQFPTFKTIPTEEADNMTAKTGIYNAINLLADRNPGFESSLTTTSPNVNVSGAVLPADSTMWFSNNSPGGSTGGARVLTGSLNRTEGDKCYLGRFESGYTYYGYKLPTLKPNTAYKASFDLVSSKTASNNKRFYLSVSTTKSASGTGCVVLNSKVAQVGLTLYVGTDSAKYEKRRPEIEFITPAVMPETGLFMNWNLLDGGDFLFNVDRMTLVEQEAVAFEPKGKITIGKNFFAGAANIEIESIKYTSDFSTSTPSVLGNNGSIIYYSGKLEVKNTSAQKIEIFSITGKKLFDKNLNSNTETFNINLQSGIYIAKAGNKIAKLIVD